jgi:hypothetical protein
MPVNPTLSRRRRRRTNWLQIKGKAKAHCVAQRTYRSPPGWRRCAAPWACAWTCLWPWTRTAAVPSPSFGSCLGSSACGVAYWVFAAGVLVRFIASAWRLARSWEPNRLGSHHLPDRLGRYESGFTHAASLGLCLSGRSRVRVRVVPARHVAWTAENLIWIYLHGSFPNTWICELTKFIDIRRI